MRFWLEKSILTFNCNKPRKINSPERWIPCLKISNTIGYNPVSAIRNKHSINFNDRLKNDMFWEDRRLVFTMSMFLWYHQVDVLDNRLEQDGLDDHRNRTHPDNESLVQAMITNSIDQRQKIDDNQWIRSFILVLQHYSIGHRLNQYIVQ